MTKIDLITGFLGSGKTTLLKKYLNYLLNQNQKICVLEFDYGAINVDMMLLQEFNDRCDIEMVAGGCDYDCHLRRFRTKLIAMGMRHYDRVIIEPSGIFDPAELFDCLNEDPLGDWYEVGSVVSVVDPNNFSPTKESKNIMATQLSYSGLIYLSKCQTLSEEQINASLSSLKSLMDEYGIPYDAGRILTTDINKFSEENYRKIMNASYKETGIQVSSAITDNDYDSLYLLDKHLSLDKISEISDRLFASDEYGHIIRIKGFVNENGKWYEYNRTARENRTDEIGNGQDAVIIIGENLAESKINSLF